MRGLILIALCMLACTASHARTFTIEDLLGLESYGQTVIVANRNLILVEKRRAYTKAADFAYDTYYTSRLVTRVMATSLARPGRLEPLFAQSSRAGYWIGSVSPDQTKAAVFRLEARQLSLGVVDLRSRGVVWLRSLPDLPAASPAPMWIDDDHLAFVAMTHPRLPASLLMGTAGTDDLVGLWRRQAQGELTRTLVSTTSGADPDGTDRRLIVVSLASGVERILATGNIVDVSLAPSRRRFAIVVAGAPVTPPPTPINGGFDSRRHRLVMIDIASGRTARIDRDVLRGVMSWSFDDRLLIVTRPGDAGDWTRAKWIMIGPRGRATMLGGTDIYAAVEESGGGRLAYAGWADSSPLALVREGSKDIWVRLSPDKGIPLRLPPTARPTGATRDIKWMVDGKLLYAVSVSGIRVAARDIEKAAAVIADPYARGFRLVRDPDTLSLAVAHTPTGRLVRRYDERGHPGREIAVPDDAQVLATDGDRVVFTRSDRRAVTSLAVATAHREPLEIDRINGALADVDLPRAIDLKTPGHDGELLHDWLLLPTGSATKPPLIVNPYPGLSFDAELPREIGINRYAITDNALLLVAARYAVLLPSMPLIKPGNPADDILPRIDAATDAAVATGLVDPIRIGLQGHSFGGYTALLVATRSTRYKAIVAANGPYDLFAMHGSMLANDRLRLDYAIPAAASIGWTEGGQGGMGAPPGSGAAAYIAASPMLHLGSVQNPVLLITGDLDFVDSTQSERAFMELYRYGKDARLARYWGENHTNASPANIRDYWHLIVSFFAENLGATATRAVPPVAVQPAAPTAITPSRRLATLRNSRGGSARGNPCCRTDSPTLAIAP